MKLLLNQALTGRRKRAASTGAARATGIGTPTLGRNALARPLWVGLWVAVFVLLLWSSDLFVQTRLRLSNALFVPRETSGQVVIVAADRLSLERYGRSVAGWPRSLHAQLVDIVSAGGARVIAFDLLFQQASEDDGRLADAIMNARTATDARTRVVMPLVGARREPGGTGSEVVYTGFLAPTDTLYNAVSALGHTNAFPDADGAVRWQPTRVRVGEDMSYSFGIVTYLSYLRIPASAYDQMIVYVDHNLVLANSRQVPIDDTGRMLINYWGGPGDNTFDTYSFSAVLDGEVDPVVFDDKIVLVGLMNHVTPDDTYQVPIGLQGGQMAGVEIHANIIETLIRNVALRSQNTASQVALIVVFAFASSLIYQTLRYRWYYLLGGLLGLLFIWLVGAFLVFNLRHQILDLFHPTLALVLPAPVILVVHTHQEILRRQQAELLLSSIVTASSQRLSVESILPGIANDIQRILRCDAVEYWLWDSGSRSFKTTFTPSTVDETNEALAIQALQANRRLHQPDRLAVPLTWQGVPLGVLVALRPARLTRTTTDLLDLFTWQTASIIANAIQYQEIQSLSELKSRMIRVASHDLRNPLTVISGYLHLIRDDYLDDESLPRKHMKFLNMMDAASENMLTIINDILSLERVRRGVTNVWDYDLVALLTRVTEQYEASARRKHQTFTVDLPDMFPILSGDETQLREVFGNLVSNAIKYTPEGGQILLRLRQADTMALIVVQDTGFGIPEEAQDHVFQEFYRVRTLDTADIEGTGLGLSLVKAIVEAHEGRVWFESEPGAGSTFFVELPITNGNEDTDSGAAS